MSETKARRFTRRQALLGSANLLALGAGAALLSACGGAPAPTAAPASDAKPTTAPSSGAAQPTTAPAKQAAPSGQVTTIQWVTPAAPGLERDFYTSFKDDFMKRNPNVKVEVSFEAWNDYFVKLPTMLAGGSIPDAMHLHGSIANEYGTKGATKNLFEYMDRDKVSRDMYFPFLLQQLSDYKTHTKLWALPKDSAVYGLYYNKEKFDKAGVAYPKDNWTVADFREIAKKLTIDKNGNPADSSKFDKGAIAQWGFMYMDPLPSGDQGNQWAWGLAGKWFSDDFSKAFFDDKEHSDWVQLIADMRCKDKSIPAAGDALGQGDAFRNELVAMKMDHHQNVFFMNAEKKTFKYDCAYVPAGPKGQYIGAACSGFTVAAKAKNADLGWQFVKFLCSEEKQCEIVSSKRWGSAVKACEKNLIPNDGNPPSFKKVFVDPMMGESTVKVDYIGYPPFLSEIKQIMATEYDAVLNCGAVTAAEAAKKAQPQIQALLDKAAKM